MKTVYKFKQKEYENCVSKFLKIKKDVVVCLTEDKDGNRYVKLSVGNLYSEYEPDYVYRVWKKGGSILAAYKGFDNERQELVDSFMVLDKDVNSFKSRSGQYVLDDFVHEILDILLKILKNFKKINENKIVELLS